jgi:hypothetical protein
MNNLFWKIGLTLLILLNTVHCGYDQGDEAAFLAAFPTLISKSYTTPLPSSLTNSKCLSDMSYSDSTVKTIPNSMNAQDAQNFCGTNTKCVVPAGMTLTMDNNLIVGSLVISGKLVWSDQTQTQADQYLCAGYIAVVNGQFTLDLNVTNSQKRAFIYLKDNGATEPTLRTRVFGGYENATIKVYGRWMTRTWSLLAFPAHKGNSSIQLLHNPADMSWRVGDRIAIAPMTTGSAGYGEVYYIKSFDTNNTIHLTSDAGLTTPASIGQEFDAKHMWIENAWTAHLSAEVINLNRNVIITGSDFKNVPCINGGDVQMDCACDKNMPRTQCTMGLQTILSGPGTMQFGYVRVEKGGQRGIMGRYPIHFHFVSNCTQCFAIGNAVEFGMQRGIIVHETHQSTVVDNVLYDVRGANLYIEDGNEMYNKINYNVAICPFDINGPQQGCTIPGTDNGQADTALNQAGVWGVSFTNYLIGNRAANSWNGMLYQEQGFPTGRNTLSGQECPPEQAIGRIEGNTFHGHGRFGTYLLASVYPKQTDKSLQCNGLPCDLSTCSAYDNTTGVDRGLPQSIDFDVDYGNVFVGQYNLGDVQYTHHTSINNLNLIYWKETKNFVDGCSAHIKDGYYAGTQASGFLLPSGHGTLIIENTQFANLVTLVSSHHCNVGVTGVLCMPTYVFVNCSFDNMTPTNQKNWIEWGENNGAMFTLGPDDCPLNTKGNPMFPAGYCSIINPYWTYLLSIDGGQTCIDCDAMAQKMGLAPGTDNYNGFMNRYQKAIFCKKTVRRLEIYTKNQTMATAPNINVELWQNNAKVSSVQVNYFQIAEDTDHTNKQGYSLTMIPGTQYTYKISLVGGGNIPANWSIEFSDTVFGNRWVRDEVNLVVAGRTCPSPVHSQHDRKYIWYDSDHYMIQTGRGACTSYPDETTINCKNQPTLNQIENCPSVCPANKCGPNEYCDCGTGTCLCNAGYNGPNCKTDTCTVANCDPQHGRCAARYLGGSLPVSVNQCVCKPGTYGPQCNANPCAGNTCSGNGKCRNMGEFDWTCECNEGYDGTKCETKCVPPSQINSSTTPDQVCQPPCYLGQQFWGGININGPDTANKGEPNAGACGPDCMSVSTCNCWVYQGTCYMKTAVSSISSNSSRVSGARCGFYKVGIPYTTYTPPDLP